MYTMAGWWMTARGNVSHQRRIRYYGSSLNLNPGAFTRMKWQLSLLRRQRVRGNLRLPVFQKIQGILKLKEGIGHISTYPLKSCLTWTKSIWLWERLTIEDLRMKWRTSMWTRLFGEDSWTPLFKQQFILVRTVIRIYDLLRIISGVLWSFSKKLKNWSRIRQKSMVLPRLISKSTHGARQAYCVTELIRSRMPRRTSSPTRCSVLGGIKENPDEAWKEKIKWNFESNHLKDLNCTDGEPMEFEWIIFQGFTTFGLFEQILQFMKERQCDPEQLEGRIIFMTMFNDITLGDEEKCREM